MATPYGTDFNRLGLDSWLEDSIRQKQAEEEEQKRAEATMALRRQGERRIPVGAMGMNLGSLPSVESMGRGLREAGSAVVDQSPFGFLNNEAPPTPPRPPGWVDPSSPMWKAQIQAAHRPSAGGSEPQWSQEKYDQTVNDMDAAYRRDQERSQQIEHPALGFSWGGGKTQDYHPGDNIRSGQYGSAPTEDSMVQDQMPNLRGSAQAHESTGGGTFSQSDMPENIGQRPPSWFEDQMKSHAIAQMDAETARAKAETEDPFMHEKIAAEASVRQRAIPGMQEEERGRQFLDAKAKLAIVRRQAMAELEARNLPPAQKEMERANIEADLKNKEGALDLWFTGKPSPGL